jgi:hypothetical protein
MAFEVIRLLPSYDRPASLFCFSRLFHDRERILRSADRGGQRSGDGDCEYTSSEMRGQDQGYQDFAAAVGCTRRETSTPRLF